MISANSYHTVDLSNKQVILPIRIPVTKHTVNTFTLIDRRATGNFVDQSFWDKNGLTHMPKTRPPAVHLVDGSAMAAGPVTHTQQYN